MFISFHNQSSDKKEKIITIASQNNYIQFEGVNQSIVTSGSAYMHMF